jgi:hypothetical protein
MATKEHKGVFLFAVAASRQSAADLLAEKCGTLTRRHYKRFNALTP